MQITSVFPSAFLSLTLAVLRLLMAFTIAITLAACAVGPDYSTPQIAIPLYWGAASPSQQSQTSDLSQWWKRLNDQTLNMLIEEAVRGNLDVAKEKAKIREARANYRQSVGSLLPSVSASGSAARTKSGATNATLGGGSGEPNTSYQSGFDSSWELDLFGANRRSTEAARYGVDAADEELRATLLTLIGDIASNYVKVRGYQARLSLARRTAKSQRATVILTRNKFEAGASSGLDVANAVGQASATEADIPSLDSALAESIHRLSVLTGRAPAALSKRLLRGGPIPRPKFPIPTGIPANILLSRPDVRYAERQLAKSTAKIGQAEADRYPSVSLTGSITTSGGKIGDLIRNSSIGWSYGPSLYIPLFNGGQLKAAVKVAEAQRDQYFIAYRSSILAALEDVENALVAIAQERVRQERLISSAKSYGEAVRLARSLYQTGSSSFLDVLTAERSLYSAEDAVILSKIAITTNYVALNKALGGGWNGLVDASKAEIVDVDKGPRLLFAQ
jgi:outer membrane protein, multidrug efflux system